MAKWEIIEDIKFKKQGGGKATEVRTMARSAVKAAATPNNLTIKTPFGNVTQADVAKAKALADGEAAYQLMMLNRYYYPDLNLPVAQDNTKVNIPIKEGVKVIPNEQKEKAIENYDEAYKWTSDYMNSPMYKKMLMESSANTAEFNDINNARWSNFKSIPPLQILPQPADHPNRGGQSSAFNGQIQLFPMGFETKGSNSHEISHSTDRPSFFKGFFNTVIPQSDKNYIEQSAPTTFKSSPIYNNNKSYYNSLEKNDPKGYKKDVDFNINYVSKDTETRARLNAIRQGAQQNNLYDPFKEGVTPELYYNKLKNFQFEKGDKSGFDPLWQLKNVYSDEEIIYMLNHISENKKEDDGTELDNLPTAKNGGKVSGWQIIEDVPKFKRGGKTNLNSTVEEEPKNTVKVNQNGQIIEYDPSSPEYKKLYESGTLTSYDPKTDAYIPPTLKEFTVIEEKPKWAKEKENNQSKYSKDWYIDNYLPKFSRNMGISADNMNPNEVERYNSFINDKTVEDIFKRYPLFDSDYANDRLGTLKQFSPKEIELIKNSSYASALEPNIGDEFDQAFLSFNSGPIQFKNENLTQEEAKEKSNPLGLLAPLSIPYNMTLGNLYTQQQGEKNYSWEKALKGQKPIHNSTAAAIAGDPLNLLGLGIFAKLSSLGKIAKLEDAYQLVKGLGKEEALSKLKSLTSLDNYGREAFTPMLDNVGVEAFGAGKPTVDNVGNKLKSQITNLKEQEILAEESRKALWADYKAGKITGEEYTIGAKKLNPTPFDNPRHKLEQQLREHTVKQNIANTPQKNILKSEDQLGKDISDGGTNNKGVFELEDNYVARLSAHGYDDASLLVNYADKIKSPRVAKTLQVKEINGKVYQVQEKVTGTPMPQLSEAELQNIPKEHIDNFWKDKAELENLGLTIDISGGKSNIFYDPKKGFQFIDLGISPVGKNMMESNEIFAQTYKGLKLPSISSSLGKPKLNFSTILNDKKNQLSKAVKGTNSVFDEIKGELLQGKFNKESIKKGNEWLKNWINHPATKEKINTDIDSKIDFVAKFFNNPFDEIDLLNLIRTQSRNFKPNSKEYSLLLQLDDNLQQYLSKKSRSPIHQGNWGVSYQHSVPITYRKAIEEGIKEPGDRYGSWISRTTRLPQSKRVSTTIHEGTHDWVSEDALEKSGIRNMAIKNMNPEIKKDFLEYENWINLGVDPVEKMGKERAYQAYLADPTEQHARIMELRYDLEIPPDYKMDLETAKEVLDWIDKGGSKIDPKFLNVIDKNPKKLAELFNKFWSVAPYTIPAGLIGAGALQQKKHGGIIEDPMGQWAHPGSVTRIPSNQITMRGVNYPVLGVSDRGHTQMMYPGEDYSFRGKSVTEYPMMQGGGQTSLRNQILNTKLPATNRPTLNPNFNPNFNRSTSTTSPLSLQALGKKDYGISLNRNGLNLSAGLNLEDKKPAFRAGIDYGIGRFSGGLNYGYNQEGDRAHNFGANANLDLGKNLNFSADANFGSNKNYQVNAGLKYNFQDGGEVNFTYAGENHRVYEKESPTGNGKGIEGHIMVNHPTENKKRWDTIDLTKITNGKVKTVAQGVASTKKWHKENPEYADGGMIKRANSTYSKKRLWDQEDEWEVIEY